MSLFVDLTQNQNSYTSIFENDTLRNLKAIHDEYGAKFSFYCFYEQNGFNLSMAPDRFHDEFQENKDWLCFGYHAKNGSTELSTISKENIITEFRNTNFELNRITGSVTNTLRLSYYHGNFAAIDALADNGVNALFTSSKNKPSYYLSSDQMELLKHNDLLNCDDVIFVHTDICLDELSYYMACSRILFESINPEQNNVIAVFTHESLLDENMLNTIDSICGFLQRHGYYFKTEL